MTLWYPSPVFGATWLQGGGYAGTKNQAHREENRAQLSCNGCRKVLLTRNGRIHRTAPLLHLFRPSHVIVMQTASTTRADLHTHARTCTHAHAHTHMHASMSVCCLSSARALCCTPPVSCLNHRTSMPPQGSRTHTRTHTSTCLCILSMRRTVALEGRR